MSGGPFLLKTMAACPYIDLTCFCCLSLESVSGLGNTRLLPELLGFEISDYKFPGRGRGFGGGWSEKMLISDLRLHSIVGYLECNQEGAVFLLRVPKFSWNQCSLCM